MSKEDKTGGPAYPTEVGPLENEHMIQTGDSQWHHPGMSLLDYFAGKALQGICAGGPGSLWTNDLIAKESYSLAESMLKAKKARTA